MCGIAGYYGFDDDKELLKKLNKLQAHRGPDGEGYYTDGKVGMAHRRLSIIDLARGNQPMKNDDGSVVVIFNGEIYNYLDLRRDLESMGQKFKTDSDTEVIVRGYDAWGEACFDKLNGMFGIALYDQKNEKLLLVRDHFGIKPVYFSNLGTDKKPKLLFASEIKPLLGSDLVDKKPNDKIIYRYLKFRIHDDGEETFFDGINRLLPGEMLVIDKSGIEKRMFTNLVDELRVQARKGTEYTSKTTDEFRTRLIESVRLRLQSDVPVGTSLSGGLDSSAVAAIINRLMRAEDHDKTVDSVGARQNTFSAVFPNSLNDEEKYVDELLGTLGDKVSSHKIKPTADEFLVDLTDFIKTQEEPIISSGPYAQYQVMREAKKHITVLLDGQGADEMMAGYIPYYFVYLRQLRRQKRYARLLGELIKSSDVLVRLGRFKLKDQLTIRKKVAIGELINPKFSKRYSGERFTTVGDNLKERLIEDIFKNSLPSLLRYEDKNTMRFSLEGRVPFLDKELLKYLFGLSDDAIIKNGWNKRILRDSMEGVLPDMINHRRNKIGFTTPEQEWFMRLKTRFYDIFLSEEFANRPYFNQNEVLKAFEGFVQGKNDTSSFLFWRILNVELWLREFFDEKVEKVVRVKSDLEANEDKKLDIKAGDVTYRRYPLRTEMISADDNLDEVVGDYLKRFFGELDKAGGDHSGYSNKKWYFYISEKIVAITQGRSYFIWDIKPGWWARTLSKFVTRTTTGIGLGSPWTMELAIREAGLPKIIFAAVGGAAGKVFGKRGLFYILVGENIRAIDGPTEYSVYPANVSAKLAPKDPSKVAARLSAVIRGSVPKKYAENFIGTVVIDSNDIGRNALGKDVDEGNGDLEAVFADNPLGQAAEQTPIAVVFKRN